MGDWKAEAQLVYAAASDAVESAMMRGHLQGYNGQWKKQSRSEHHAHGMAHFQKFMETGSWEDFENGLTRYAMIGALAKMDG